MNNIKKEDLKFGINSEKTVIKQLSEYYNTELVETPKFFVCDFINNDFCVELKTRKNNYKQYPTTMIGQNKIDYMKKQLKEKRCILAFKFYDGLYIFELTKESLFDLTQNKSGGRDDRGINEWKNSGYCYIPITLLTKI